MGETASVGELFVKISGTSEGLVDAAKKGVVALQQMDATGGRLRMGILTTSQLVTSGIVAMLGALDLAVKKSVDKMEEMGKSAQQIGVAVEQFSRLEFAAKKAGVASEELAQGIKLFARQAGEIRSAIEAPDAFALTMRNLQVDLNGANGKVRDTTSLLLDLADRFSRMPDGVQKTRMAIELFGRSGAEMIPFLNQGREKIQAFMDTSDRLGLTIDKKATDSALRFNNALRAITGTFDSVVKRAVQDFLPTMEDMATRLTASIRSADNMSLAFTGVQTVLKATAGTIEFVTGAFRVLLEHIGGATKVITSLIAGDFTGALTAAMATLAILPNAVIEQFNKLRGSVKGASDEVVSAGDAMEKGVVAAGQKISEAFKPVERTAKQAADEFTRTRRTVMDGLTLGYTNVPEVMSRLSAAFKKGDIDLQEFEAGLKTALEFVMSDAGASTETKIAAVGIAANVSKTQVDELQLRLRELKRTSELEKLEDVTSPADGKQRSAEEQAAAHKRARDQMAISERQYGRAVQEVERQNQANMLETATVAASAITTMFGQNKAAAVGSAIINTAVGVTKALSIGPPWGFIQAGLVAAAGAAQVATISAASQNGGGSVPSVSGSSSSPSAAAAPAVEAPQDQRTLQIMGGFSMKDFYSGDHVKGIIEAIEAQVRDGRRVVFS